MVIVLGMTTMGIIFREIERAQTGIEMKVKPFGVTGLSITEASKLLSISKNKFNLSSVNYFYRSATTIFPVCGWE